jgi:hypothetical protein
MGRARSIASRQAKPLLIAKGRRWEWAKMPEASKGFSTMGMVWGGLIGKATLGDRVYVGTAPTAST